MLHHETLTQIHYYGEENVGSLHFDALSSLFNTTQQPMEK